MKAIEVVNEINTFLEDTMKRICAEENIDYEFHYHSNVIPETNSRSLRIYVNRRIVREQQDTLAVDVEDFGRVRYTSEGVYALSFFMARSVPKGFSTTERIVQKLKNALRKERFDCLWVRNPTGTPYSMENHCYRYELTFSYEFDEII